ncbi:MAG: hypothetical protein HYW25_00710 [Candidatus Aenigmarchaeota archaeon]|nr:hypothetical protein [Candidatus Aenigmarchaeota archaeon]
MAEQVYVLTKPLETWAMLLIMLVFVVVFFTTISSMGENAVKFSLAATTAEIASIAGVMQEAPEGSVYELLLPRLSSCELRIHENFVDLKSGQRVSAASIISVDGKYLVESWQKSEDCSRNQMLVFRRQDDKVNVEATEPA